MLFVFYYAAFQWQCGSGVAVYDCGIAFACF